MEFFEVIESRRSVRSFTKQEVPQEYIDKILKAAITSPSSKNSRSTRFLVIKNKEMLDKMSQMRDLGTAFLKEAPVAILVTGDESISDLWLDNASVAASYIQLAATALGLGSCWAHANGRLRRRDKPAAGTSDNFLRTFIPIPEGHKILCAVAIGYQDFNAEMPDREPFNEAEMITVVE